MLKIGVQLKASLCLDFRGEENITHLQFSDDFILYSSTRVVDIVVIKRILGFLRSFLSCLKINLGKSLLVGIGELRCGDAAAS